MLAAVSATLVAVAVVMAAILFMHRRGAAIASAVSGGRGHGGSAESERSDTGDRESLHSLLHFLPSFVFD